MAHQAGVYPGVCSMTETIRSISTPPGWDASPPPAGLPPTSSLSVSIYTPGWREELLELSVLSKNKRQCPRPGLEPEPLDPETSSLTMKPLSLLTYRKAINKTRNPQQTALLAPAGLI